MNKSRVIRLVLLMFSVSLCQAEHSFVGNDKGNLTCVNKDQSIQWQIPWPAIHDIHILDNGNILTHKKTTIIELSPEHKQVWSYDVNKHIQHEGKIEVHSFVRLPNGNTMIAVSGKGVLIEVTPEKKLVHTIKLKLDHPQPHRDTRLVRLMTNGNYLVCHEGEGAVREYNHQGEVVWDFPVPMFGRKNEGKGHGPETFGNKVFGATRLKNGNTLIATGNGHSVLEVTPKKKIVWHLKQNDLPGITLSWTTIVKELDNGHYLIGNCHAEKDNPQIIEVDKDKKVHWTYHDFDHFGNSFPVFALINK